MSDQTVADGKVVSIHFTLKDSGGLVLDKTGDEPLHYLHGSKNIVPGLEKQLAGKTIGDRVKTIVPIDEAYGKRRNGLEKRLPRSSFPADQKIARGMRFVMQSKDQRPTAVWVVHVERDFITVDMNHPLAGKKLHFDVEIAAIRDATEEEKQHGHAHGADGKAHAHGADEGATPESSEPSEEK